MPDVIFQGPAGRLEGKYFAQKNPESPIVVILHPHPLHGGTMNNKVTYRLFETFVRYGFSALRFNFRGWGIAKASSITASANFPMPQRRLIGCTLSTPTRPKSGWLVFRSAAGLPCKC